MLLTSVLKYSATKPPPALVCGNASKGTNSKVEAAKRAAAQAVKDQQKGWRTDEWKHKRGVKVQSNSTPSPSFERRYHASTIAVWLTPNQNGGLKAGANSRKAAAMTQRRRRRDSGY